MIIFSDLRVTASKNMLLLTCDGFELTYMAFEQTLSPLCNGFTLTLLVPEQMTLPVALETEQEQSSLASEQLFVEVDTTRDGGEMWQKKKLGTV